MNLTADDIERLEEEFAACRKTLTALGDEMRQNLLILMVQYGDSYFRVINIAEMTSLSRPAISHHLQILKDAGIVRSHKEGRYTYYCFDKSVVRINALQQLLEDMRATILKSTEPPC